MPAVQPHIPGYELLEMIGEGGMASVWKARHTRLDRLTAIKVLRYRLSEAGDDLDRFRQEARTAAAVNHPSVVQVYDAGEQEGLVYYVMEYVPGCSLGDLLEIKKTIPESEALNVATELAKAMDHCWNAHKMIHFDIKPDNILLHSNGTVKIADLGLASVIGLTRAPLGEEYTIGTPAYMSPEQALVLPGIDCRTDMYSLGAMLYHCLTGVMPFAGCSSEETLQHQIHDRIPDPIEMSPHLSPGVPWLIEKLMAKDPKARHVSWAEVASDIDRVRQGLNIGAPLADGEPSTISRSALRKTPPMEKRRGFSLPKRAATRQPQGPNARKVVVSEQDRQKLTSFRDAEWEKNDDSTMLLCTLAAVVFVLYAFSFFVSRNKPLSATERILPASFITSPHPTSDAP